MTRRKLLVFGGTGFVGSRVLHKALDRGWRVVCATRGGLPPVGSPFLDEIVKRHHHNHNSRDEGRHARDDGSAVESSASSGKPLEFVSLDATSRLQVFHFFKDHPDAAAVVSCVGLLSRNHVEARRVCGDANVNIAAAVYECGAAVGRAVLVSAEPLDASIPLLASRFLLKGYFAGKKVAERALLENLGDRGVVLRPGFIYGTRYVHVADAFVPLPLWLLGCPLEIALRPLHARGALLPPVDVDVVAEAAVRCAEVGAPSGVLDYYKMREVCSDRQLRGDLQQ